MYPAVFSTGKSPSPINGGYKPTDAQSALFVLFSKYNKEDPQLALAQDLGDPLDISAETCLYRARIFLGGNLGTINAASPFLVNWGLQAFRYYYLRYHKDGHSESFQALQDLRRALEVFDERWKLAGKKLNPGFGCKYILIIVIGTYMVLINKSQTEI